MTADFRKFWLPVVVWAALIFTVSSISRFPREVDVIFSFDDVAHAAEYAVLSFLLARALKNSAGESISRSFRIFAVIIAVVYGVSDEFHQMFVPLRTPSVMDLFFDSIGAVAGQFLYRS